MHCSSYAVLQNDAVCSRIKQKGNRNSHQVLGRDMDVFSVLQKPSKRLSPSSSINFQPSIWLNKAFFFCFYSKMMLPLLLTGDSKLNPVLAVYLPQKRLFYSSQSAAMVYKAGPWPLVSIQRGFLRFKFLTQGSLGQRCGGVGTSRSLGFISASGTPQRYRSWLLCSSLLLMRGPSYWQRQDERRGQKGIFFILGWVGFLPMHSW